MTIDEAIRNLRIDLLRPGSVDKLDFQGSERLGIEALKRAKTFREQHLFQAWILLPGETEELHPQGLPLGGIVVKVEKGDQKWP